MLHVLHEGKVPGAPHMVGPAQVKSTRLTKTSHVLYWGRARQASGRSR